MNEKIYTIPVNEAFEASASDPSLGCPFCALYNQLEEAELDRILGASMMEPDVRIETNEKGFCNTHFQMMFVRKNRLGLGLILESHLAELHKGLRSPLLSLKSPGTDTEKRMERLESTCYLCERIETSFGKMIKTAVLLWENEKEFREKTAGQPFFCLPHYRRFLSAARSGMGKKTFAQFYEAVSAQQGTYLDSLSEDVSWFCKKFDYRYKEEPWNNSKDAIERTIRFLSSDLHREPQKKNGS